MKAVAYSAADVFRARREPTIFRSFCSRALRAAHRAQVIRVGGAPEVVRPE